MARCGRESVEFLCGHPLSGSEEPGHSRDLGFEQGAHHLDGRLWILGDLGQLVLESASEHHLEEGAVPGGRPSGMDLPGAVVLRLLLEQASGFLGGEDAEFCAADGGRYADSHGLVGEEGRQAFGIESLLEDRLDTLSDGGLLGLR